MGSGSKFFGVVRRDRKWRGVLTAAATLTLAQPTFAQTVLLSDSFSRTPLGTAIGSPVQKDVSAAAQAAADANWISSWGANNNTAGGSITQTYTTYLDGTKRYKADGANGISGNWLNNGTSLGRNTGGGSTTEPIGLPGFAWVQVDHDFAANPTALAAGKLRVSFDVYRPAGGNVSWFFGQSDPTGVANGNAGSPAVIASNDIALYFRGYQASTFGLRDNGALPTIPGIANADTISYAAGSNAASYPMAVTIDITTGDYSAGSNGALELWVNNIPQDLNGTAVGNQYGFQWDAGGKAYMGFGSNSTAVTGTVAAPVPMASGVDNFVVSAIAPVVPFTWNVDADGAWDTGSNWTGGTVPNGNTVTATLGGVVTVPRTVTLASAITLQALVVSSGVGSYVIDSPGAARLSVGTLDVRNGRLDLDDSGNMDSVTQANALTIAVGARLNLDGGSLVLEYSGISPLASVVADILANKITGDGAAVAVVEASALGVTTFRNVAVDASALLLIRTLKGDSDLDQDVDFNDLVALAQNYGGLGKDWTDGDSDYNGTVDFNDLVSLAQNYNSSLLTQVDLATLTGVGGVSFAADFQLAASLVPEPASGSIAGLLAAFVGCRRRRNF